MIFIQLISSLQTIVFLFRHLLLKSCPSVFAILLIRNAISIIICLFSLRKSSPLSHLILQIPSPSHAVLLVCFFKATECIFFYLTSTFRFPVWNKRPIYPHFHRIHLLFCVVACRLYIPLLLCLVPPLILPVSSNSSPEFAPYVPNFKFPTCYSHLLPRCLSCPICLILHQYCTTRHNIISPTFSTRLPLRCCISPMSEILETLTKSPLNTINYFAPPSLALIST